MQTQQISLAATEFDGGIFTAEKIRDGKAVIIYNPNHMFGPQCEQLANCGLLSKLAEISLTVAGMTVLGNSKVKEMEIEILGDNWWDNLEAVAEILYSEENSATGRSDIRVGKQGTLVARAFGTVLGTEKSLSENEVLAG